jgi:uncharacterized repeat protein (TIGR03803 family)
MNVKNMGARIVLLLGVALPGPAQVFTTLHDFTNTPDGANPLRLTSANGLLFGSTVGGGAGGNGSLFVFNPNRSTFTTLYGFSGAANNGGSPNNILAGGGTIYGDTYVGGTNGLGMVYAVGTNGAGLVPLYSFAGNPDGEYPQSGLLLSGNALYGTTYVGGPGSGSAAGGTVFKIGTNGAGYTVLHAFTNSPDGAQSQGELVLGGSTLFGLTADGGANGKGTVFAVNTDGSGYTILHSFTNAPEPIYPYGGLVLSGATLYGTGSSGGANTNGAIFAVNTNGGGFKTLYSFSPITGNTDGGVPKATLTFSGNCLYGTTTSGGSGNGGTVFLINTNGTGFTVIASFTNGAASGSDLQGGVIRLGNALWGTTRLDGAGYGTLFKIPLPAILSQPQSATVTNSNSATFSVSAVDDSAITYQWYFNTNTLLAGQTNGTLTLTGGANTAGAYTVVAADGSGSVTSSPAWLTVVGKPVITQQPQSLVVSNGDAATFTAAASGPGVLSFQWYFRTNTAVSGATNTSLAFTNAITNLAGYYCVRVTNSQGAVTSSYALLAVSNHLNFLSFSFNPTSGSASFALANVAKSTNRLWASSNLAVAASWRAIATNVMGTNGLWFFTDANAARTNPARFYRFSTP